MPVEEASPAIVLRTRDYSESDRIVTLLTREFGKLSGIAKGAKVSRRRFERKLEVFSHVMLYFRRRPHGDLVFITRAESASLPSLELADDLAKIALGSYMVELADALTREEAEAAAAYQILVDSLSAISHHGARVALRQAYELNMLRWAGYGLEFARCRACSREPGPEVTSVAFIPSRGGIVCRLCRDSLGGVAVSLTPVSAATLARLGTISIADAANEDGAGADAKLAIARFIASIVDRKLRSLEFLDSLA